MRFNFDFSGSNDDGRQSTPPSTSTPAEDVQWLPLQNHPVFSAADGGALPSPPSTKTQTNLLAWDGASRLYFWDPSRRCLHRIAIKLGGPDSSSILAASPSKILQPDKQLDYDVQKISINRNGSAIFLSGVGRLCVMYLFGRSSSKQSAIICRTVSIGSDIFFDGNNLIRLLQVCWHPCSDTHIGILSSDSVFRLFNLSESLQQPEQEYYLQPVEPKSLLKASSICPVDFSFGGNHLWDRFSVFVLFSDGSVYVLCPVIPFGSTYRWETLLELHSDAHTFGLKSSNSKAIRNSNMAISWLEATFPQLAQQATESGGSFALKAQPYAFMDSSLLLQGPLCNMNNSEKESDKIEDAESEGYAVSFLYNLVGKDSLLISAWSGGLLQIDALADEIQPVWKDGCPPRLFVDSSDRILGVAMICESVSSDLGDRKPDLSLDTSVWLGHPPPLLRLAVVDLALPGKGGSCISLYVDNLMPERIYCLHDGGVDAIVLHFLPFTNQAMGKEGARNPSVHPVISSCQGESSPLPICGFLSLADSVGDSWIVGLTQSRECIVSEMETWKLSVPCVLDQEKDSSGDDEQKKTEIPTIISKDLLAGPKIVVLPPSSPDQRSVAADSIDGRSVIHRYFKIFHENYMEYALKVHFELQHHAPHVKKIIDDQHSRLQKVEQKLLQVEEKQEELDSRITHAIQRHSAIEERLLKLRNLRGLFKKPLSKAERDFKSELDRFTGVELDALRSTVEALDARLRRLTRSPQAKLMNKQSQRRGRRANYVQEDEISLLKSSMSKLSLINNENTKKAKLIESALSRRDLSKDQ
ncbi:OLC1v1026783C1 [Oldenlandia corymbosa var. corymbosa]|uniref:OLC1v1026783C1 n=1 Tax=Oldenlandia corymbosa var. corymbosa TaxID=529605 RepID=A0AAV1C7V2_OLDCO|nr:OLC1v1026783C1 [Oldenlandia corymbosa var. corymbosa]